MKWLLKHPEQVDEIDRDWLKERLTNQTFLMLLQAEGLTEHEVKALTMESES
ncbi:MAG: hypothetical protein HQL50_08275 [Magnetococcales bacterium]|nr:hypothetical protein [Magnetococcales bacterium]